MNLHEEMKAIESHEMAVRLNLALSLHQLFKIAQGEEAINSLRNKLNDEETIKSILLRIHELVELSPDPRYENPYDTAVAVYTWVLYTNNLSIGRLAAEYASRLRQGFWAPEYARQILVGNLLWNGASISKQIIQEPLASTKTEASGCLTMTDMIGGRIWDTNFFITLGGEPTQPERWAKPSEKKTLISTDKYYNPSQAGPGVRILSPV